MKILLVCAGGMSTGLLMKKIEILGRKGRRQQYQCRRTFGIHGCI